MRMSIVYASQTGRTGRMAEAAAEGARGEGADVALVEADGAEPEALVEADAVLLGSGVHMAGMEPAMSAFLARTAPLWLAGRLEGKVGGAFVSAGAGGRGGGELVLLSLLAALAEHGLLIVPMHNRLEGFSGGGCHWGPLAWTAPREGRAGPTEVHLTAARSHAAHVARTATRWLASSSSSS
ncbi:MAG: flavodoxin domain-containing protein [Myxococcota bacterium]